MAVRDTAIVLLQVVALVLPAVAIYLQILSSRHDLEDMDDGLAANYHAVRLTFVSLLFSGLVLLGLILVAPAWGEALLWTAIIALGFGLSTFGLPIVFSQVGLSDSRTILWPYRNLWHRLRDKATNSNHGLAAEDAD
ncbi:hypothetical protein ACKVMT_02850 [Halobacteriales archaeon Cl-PHB]